MSAKQKPRSKTEAIAIAEKIIADQTFFGPEFAKKVQTVLPDVVSGVFGAFLFVVPSETQPEFAAISKKYGAPDSVTEASRAPSAPGLPVSPVDTLYKYGALQLGIPKGSSTGKVEVVKIIQPK